ncbi:MAG: hypothetical protein EVA70_03930 [Parvularculaceae bacterium]|nr:MAG: hypothetical protein EVA70_03930 [Parvularculaceae bacterium]
MIFLLQLIALGIFGLLAVNIWNSASRRRDRIDTSAGGPVIDGEAREVGPGHAAAETLREFEQARAAIKATYPTVFAMLGGYLNAHSIEAAGGIELAVKRMIDDWASHKDEVVRELTTLLADNHEETEARAIVLAACDAEFEQEGYRKWLTWLLGRFNAL